MGAYLAPPGAGTFPTLGICVKPDFAATSLLGDARASRVSNCVTARLYYDKNKFKFLRLPDDTCAVTAVKSSVIGKVDAA